MREGEAGINMERVVVLNIVHASGRSRRHNLQPSFVCFDTGRSSVAKVTNRVGKQFPFLRGNCLSTAGKRFMCTGFPSSLSPEVKIKGDCVTCNQNFLCRVYSAVDVSLSVVPASESSRQRDLPGVSGFSIYISYELGNNFPVSCCTVLLQRKSYVMCS